jgi:TP901 family phage tail tape measure protein
MPSAGTAWLDIVPRIDPAALSRLQSQLGELGGQVGQKVGARIGEEASRALAEKGQLIAGLGDKLTLGLTAPLVGLGTVALKEFAQVEAGLAEVVSLTGEVGPQAAASLKEFSGGLSSLSSEIGLTQDNLVGGLYQALSAGVPRDNVFEFLEIAGKAAIAGVSDTETAVDGLTTIVNSYGSDVIDAARAADVAFATVKAGKTDFQQLSSSLANVLPIASNVGVSFEEVGAAIAQLTARGVGTSEATTQLRGALSELSAAGTDVSDAFTEVAGKSFREFIEGGGDMTGALEILGMAAKNQGVEISDLFGSVEAGSAILGLAGDNLDAYRSQVENMANSTGAAADAFSVIDESTSRKFERLSVAAKNVAIEIGAALVPAVEALLPFVQTGVGFIGDLAEAFDGLSPALKQVAVVFGGFLAAVGPFLSIRGRLIGLFVELKPALAAVLTPTTLLVSGLALLAAGLVIAYQNSETFRDVVHSVLGTVVDTFRTVVDQITTFAGAVRDGFNFGTTLGEDIGGIVGVGEKLGGLISTLVLGFQDLGASADNFPGLAGVILRFGQAARRTFDTVLAAAQTVGAFLASIDWGEVFATVASAAETAFGVVSSVVRSVVGFLSRIDWARAFDAVRTTLSTVADVVTTAFDVVADAVTAVVRVLGSIDWAGIFGGIAGAVGEVVDLFQDSWPKISDSVSGVVTILTQFARGAIYVVREIGQAFGELASIISTAFDAVWPVIRVALAPIAIGVIGAVQAIQTIWDRFGEHIVDAIQTAWNLVSGIISGALSTIQGIINIFAGILTGDWSRIWDGLTQVVSGVWQTITTIFSTGWQAVQLAIQVGITAVRAIWDAAWAALSTVVTTVWSTISGAVTGGFSAITGAISTGIAAVRAIWDAAWAAITAVFTTTWNTITGAMSAAWQAITSTVTTGITTVVTFISGLPGQITGALASLPGLLLGFGAEMINGLLTAAQTAWTAVTSWLGQIPSLIVSAIGSLVSTLSGAGRDLIVGLRSAAIDAFGGVTSWLGELPGRIVSAVGDLSRVLFNAGKSVIGGFIDGIKSMIGSVADTLGGITSSLTSWKGPPDKDAVILRPAGRLVLGGFISGIEDKIPALATQLQDLTADMPDFVSVPPPPQVEWAAQSKARADQWDAALRELVTANPRGEPVEAATGTTFGEIVFEMDGQALGRALVPGLRSAQRERG